MNWFINLSTRAKLAIAFGTMCFLLVIVIGISIIELLSLARSEREMHTVHDRVALDLRELRSRLNYNRAMILEMMLTNDIAAWNTFENEIKAKTNEINQIIATTADLDSDEKFRDGITDLAGILDEYNKTREQQITLIHEGKKEEAIQMGSGAQSKRYNDMHTITMDLSDHTSSEANLKMEADSNAAQLYIYVFAGIGAIAILLGLLMIAVLNKTLVNPLKNLTGAAERIALGDLSSMIPANARKDEVGLLLQAFRRMIQSLNGMAVIAERIAAGDLRVSVVPQSDKDILGVSFARMLEGLHHSTSDIAEAVELLGSSANEIQAAATQVASGTAETATALSETTTTVEEVRQAAQLSAGKAASVAENAQHVVQVSRNGQKAVEETASGMRLIKEQIGLIANTVVRLSEQSQSISGIIATVTDLADQSNLLAVNAAIEAARAGEQGKGFAIVAQEIRSLAEQSKHATTEVRTILNEIQKATGAAVMATEQGSKAVEAGVKQSAQAGEAIRALADTSVEAAQMATQIAASSQQQVIGMDQIGVAMENISQAGAENAASMVQVEMATRNLQEMGQKLKQLIEQYQM